MKSLIPVLALRRERTEEVAWDVVRAVALSVDVKHRTCMVYSVGDSTPESAADRVINFVPAVERSGKLLVLPEDYRRLIAES